MTIQSYMLQLRVKTGGGMHKKSRQLVMNQRSFFLKIGRGDRTRTCDSLVPNQERYQLRYTSVVFCFAGAKVRRKFGIQKYQSQKVVFIYVF